MCLLLRILSNKLDLKPETSFYYNLNTQIAKRNSSISKGCINSPLKLSKILFLFTLVQFLDQEKKWRRNFTNIQVTNVLSLFPSAPMLKHNKQGCLTYVIFESWFVISVSLWAQCLWTDRLINPDVNKKWHHSGGWLAGQKWHHLRAG